MTSWPATISDITIVASYEVSGAIEMIDRQSRNETINGSSFVIMLIALNSRLSNMFA